MLQPLLKILDAIGRFPHPNVFEKPVSGPPLRADAVFRAWAPPSDSPWFAYAKATLFASLERAAGFADRALSVVPATQKLAADGARLAWPQGSAAVLADLPMDQSVVLALYFAEHHGYQPVALFNNWPHARGVVPCDAPAFALKSLAANLSQFQRPPSAPPFFMVQAERLRGRPIEEDFDNRYFLSEEDLPDADRFKRHGITDLYYLTEALPETDDMNSYLCGLLREGIRLWLVRLDDLSRPEPFDIKHRETSLSNYVSRQFHGFRRSGAGGFGAWIPPASSGG